MEHWNLGIKGLNNRWSDIFPIIPLLQYSVLFVYYFSSPKRIRNTRLA